MQRTRTSPTRPRSVFTRKSPPPDEPPEGITEIMAWQLASSQWREHLPDDLLGVDCLVCRTPWPCDAWQIADDMLNDCCASAAAG